VGRWSNRGGQRRCRRWRRCPQQEGEGDTLDLDSRNGGSHERRIRCSQRSEGRGSPPLVRRSISDRQAVQSGDGVFASFDGPGRARFIVRKRSSPPPQDRAGRVVITEHWPGDAVGAPGEPPNSALKEVPHSGGARLSRSENRTIIGWCGEPSLSRPSWLRLLWRRRRGHRRQSTLITWQRRKRV
jgi:hypothetical protein